MCLNVFWCSILAILQIICKIGYSLFPCRPISQVIGSLLYSSFINNLVYKKNFVYKHCITVPVVLGPISYTLSMCIKTDLMNRLLSTVLNECDVIALTQESGVRQSLYRRDEDLRWSLSSVWCWSMCSNSCSSTRDTRTWCRTSRTLPSSTSSTEKGKLITSMSVGLEIDFL